MVLKGRENTWNATHTLNWMSMGVSSSHLVMVIKAEIWNWWRGNFTSPFVSLNHLLLSLALVSIFLCIARFQPSIPFPFGITIQPSSVDMQCVVVCTLFSQRNPLAEKMFGRFSFTNSNGKSFICWNLPLKIAAFVAFIINGNSMKIFQIERIEKIEQPNIQCNGGILNNNGKNINRQILNRRYLQKRIWTEICYAFMMIKLKMV